MLRRLIIAAALPASVTTVFAADPAFVLREHVVTRADQITLGELVESCPDPVWARTAIVSSPRWGGTVSLSRDDVQRRALQALRRVVHISGAARVRISRPGGNRAPEIERQMRLDLDAALSERQGVEATLAFPPTEIALPPGEIKIECHMPEKFEGMRAITADVSVNGKAERRVSAVCRFVQTLDVPLAARKLARGDTVRADDVRWESRAFSSHPPDVLGDTVNPGDYRMRCSVNEGDMLTTRTVEPHPAVIAGSEVEMVMTRSAIRVRARATALQTGWVGSRIRVRSSVDQRYLFARIIEKGIVAYE